MHAVPTLHGRLYANSSRLALEIQRAHRVPKCSRNAALRMLVGLPT